MTTVIGFRLVEVVVASFAFGSALVGLYIAAQAYRALRRHESRQMLCLSIGMILLFGVAYAIGFVGTVLLQLRILSLPAQDLFRLAVRVSQFVGLLAIAYSLSLRE